MKLFALLTVVLAFSTHATAICEVDGISDSPQSLHCTFKNPKVLNLSCVESVYHLDNEVVFVAWHEDVEDGNSPLIFKTKGQTLRVVMDDRGPSYTATLESSKTQIGTCR
jgi:hypothetical protein